MVPHKRASTSNSVQTKKHNNKKQSEKVITHHTSEVQLHTVEEKLFDHLTAKIREIVPDEDAPEVSAMLVRDHKTADVFHLLQDPEYLITEIQNIRKSICPKNFAVRQHLEESVTPKQFSGHVNETGYSERQMETLSRDKLHLGEDLFHKVAGIETELCAQITGMLLEIDEEWLNKLLLDDEMLESAVSRARMKYLAKHHPSVLPAREDMGEELYEAVHNIYPDHAAKITGMLLELDADTIQQLLDSPTELEIKARVAYETAKQCSS